MAGFDAQHGGFGNAPKFPPSMSLSFLMRAYLKTGGKHLLECVELTLQKMACGGMYDQLGGGFHRYSVDPYWLVPHFEKMLYDNALLSRAYLDAYLLTGNPFYRRISEETLDYVRREMTSPEGGFYSAQDADSEGEEGKFYIWNRQQVEAILGPGDAEIFCRHYDVTEEGNFEGRTILNVPHFGYRTADAERLSESEFQRLQSRGRKLLFEEREKRIKPFRDEKILTAWNGLMLRSFAEAAAALGREDYREIAVRNADFVLSELQQDGGILRSYKDGRARFNAYLEDYANLIDGLLSLYEATFDARWLHEAERLAAVLIEQFRDTDGTGFYLTSKDHEDLIHRPKDLFDNATPSGNSVAIQILLRLWKFTGQDRWYQPVEPIMESMADLMALHPSAVSHLLCGLDFMLSTCREIAVVGDPEAEQTQDLLSRIFGRYMPNKVVACGLDSDLFLLKEREQVKGQATVYMCENYICKSPVTDPKELGQLLDAR
jgi:uncharacterized protein YyaL (SSP411 family)